MHRMRPGIARSETYAGYLLIKESQNWPCHQLISHPEKIEKRAEKPLKIILL